jgi:hypothetical protein
MHRLVRPDISDWPIGWRQDGSRERSVNTGAHWPRFPSRLCGPSVRISSTARSRHGILKPGSEWERMGAATGSAVSPWYARTCAYVQARTTAGRGLRCPAEWCK